MLRLPTLLTLAMTAVALTPACGDDAPAGPAVPEAPRFTATLADDGAVVLARDGAPLTRLDLPGLEVGALDDPREADEWTWDPWWLDSDDPIAALAEPPPGLRFGRPADIGLALTTALEAVDGQRFRVRIASDAAAAERVTYVRVALAIAPDERFYGGGNRHAGVELHGSRLAMQLEADTTRESGYNERHVPVPLVLSTRGWALFVASRRAMVVDVGAADPTRLVVTVAVGGRVPGATLADGLDLWLFAAPTVLDLLLPYYRTTAPPRVPPDWGFGPWYWRNEVAGEDAARADLRTLRDLHLPASAYWIDRPYATALQTFDFDPARYDDPGALIREARAAGFRVALWHTPYATPEATATRAAVDAGGFFPPVQGIALNTFGSPPLDVTNSAAVTYWQSRLAAYRALGVEGWKLDFAEDVVLGLPGRRANRWAFADGSDERTMHARYAGLYHDAYRAPLADADQGGFILARAGHWGGQAKVDAIWPGDLDAGFERPGEDHAVGGIPAALAYNLSLSASGYPFFAADTGGYRHGPPDSEAYRRWFEMTAVTPVMEVGGGDNQVPWEAERWGWDAALLDDFRRYASLHLRLYPYVRALCDELLATGRPPVRAFGLAHPELGLHPDDAYFLGEDLLVAPVVARGAVSRAVPFPAGRWVDWWDGAVRDVATAGEVEVPAPLGRLPLFLREGAIVPLLDPSAETLAPADGARVGGALWVRVVPGAAARTLVLGDGTRLSVTPEGAGAVRLAVEAGSRWGPAVTWQVMGDGAVRDVPTTAPASVVVPFAP